MTAILNIPARRAGASDATVELPHIPKLPWDQQWTPCTDSNNDPDLWHARKYDRENTARAKHLCRTKCPVMWKCREHAITAGESQGVWGGLTGKELTAERRARRLAR